MTDTVQPPKPDFIDASEQTIIANKDLGHEPVRLPYGDLIRFSTAFFVKMGLNELDATGAAEVLVTSDLRGIESHGVPRLDMYKRMFENGWVIPNAPLTTVRESPSTALVDANLGLGLVVGRKAMELAISKAQQSGVGLVAVTQSSHFGIAGFYPEMAIKHDMIGIAATNATPQVVPANGIEARLGTNPWAFGAPAQTEYPFLLDMATSAVAFGKVEIAARQEKSIPLGWSLDVNGEATTDPNAVFASHRLLPLGSLPELSHHKGYGLAVMVDILVGVLSGMGHSMKVPRSRAGHFFGALRIDNFRDIDEFKVDMDEMIRDLRNTPTAEGAKQVYVAGEKEYLAQAENLRLGVPLHPKVVQRMKELGQELDIPFGI